MLEKGGKWLNGGLVMDSSDEIGVVTLFESLIVFS